MESNNNTLSADSIFNFSIFNREKPKLKPRGRSTESSHEGNLIVHIIDTKAPEVLKWLKSIVGIEKVNDIEVLLTIFGTKRKLKKHKDLDQYLLYLNNQIMLKFQ